MQLEINKSKTKAWKAGDVWKVDQELMTGFEIKKLKVGKCIGDDRNDCRCVRILRFFY